MFTPSTAPIFRGRHDLFDGTQDECFDDLVCDLGSAFTLKRKLDSIIFNHNGVKDVQVFTPMTQSQAIVYSKLKRSFAAPTGGELTASSLWRSADEIQNGYSGTEVLNYLFSILMVCCHVNLLTNDLLGNCLESSVLLEDFKPFIKASTSVDINSITSGSGKFSALDLILKRILDDDGVVLIISRYTAALNILEDFCLLMEYSVLRFDAGAVPKQRKLDAADYMTNSREVFVYLCSPECVPEMTCSSVNNVIFFDSAINLGDDHSLLRYLRHVLPTAQLKVWRLLTSQSLEEKLFDAVKYSDSDLRTVGADLSGKYSVPSSRDEKSSSGTSLAEDERLRALDELSRCASTADLSIRQHSDVAYLDYAASADAVEFSLFGPPEDTDDSNSESRSELNDDGSKEDVVIRVIVEADQDGNNLTKVVSEEEAKVVLKQVNNEVQSSPSWLHNDFCCICGSIKVPGSLHDDDLEDEDEYALMLCKLCPRAFHSICFANANLPKELSVLENSVVAICPQHKCECDNAVGSVSFPCYECLAVFCENCIDEDVVDSIGRLTPYNTASDFYCRSRHFIRCEPCTYHKWRLYHIFAPDEDTDSSTPAQRVRIFATCKDFGKRATKRKVGLISTEAEMDAYEKKRYESEPGVAALVNAAIYFNSIRLCPPRRVPVYSEMTFFELFQGMSRNSPAYVFSNEFSVTATAHYNNELDPRTKLACDINDEVLGAVSLGYHRVVFEIQSKSKFVRPQRKNKKDELV